MQFTCPESVTHPTTNRAQYRATALMRPTRYDHDDDAMARPSKSKALSTTLRQAERSAARRHAVWRPQLSGLRSASTVRSQDWRRRSLGQWRNYILTKGTAGAVAPPPGRSRREGAKQPHQMYLTTIKLSILLTSPALLTSLLARKPVECKL